VSCVCFPFFCILAGGMVGPSRPDTAQTDASTPTLTLPQYEAEKVLQTQSKAADDSNQDTELQSPVEKGNAREDAEWLENPAHPRNWRPRKKWSNMAIVSESLYCSQGLTLEGLRP
jgi:hypothetical protein